MKIFSSGGTGEVEIIFHDSISIRIVISRQVFPSYSSTRRLPSKDSALAKIRERRAALRAVDRNIPDMTD